MNVFVRFGLLVALAAGLPNASSAIVATPRPSVCAAFTTADIVVAAHVGNPVIVGEWQQWSATVVRRYKGRVPSHILVLSPNDSARATPDARQRNILFLYRQQDRLFAYGSDPNGGGATWARVEPVVRMLAQPRRRTMAVVHVLVASETGQVLPDGQLQLREATSGRVVRARSDRQGEATIVVRPGHWSVRINAAGMQSRQSIYSDNDPNDLNLSAGGCADVRIEPILGTS